MKEIESKNVLIPDPDEIQTVTGRGIKVKIDVRPYWLGNEKSIEHITIPPVIQTHFDAMKADGLTLVLVADNELILGLIGIADEIRDESRSVIASLHMLGIKKTVMLTGDHQKTEACYPKIK